MGFLRLVVFGFVGLSILYFAISTYSRSVRREKLEKYWDENEADNPDAEARTAFIEAGMAQYNSGIRPKLILLVYVVPAVIVAVIHTLTTYY